MRLNPKASSMTSKTTFPSKLNVGCGGKPLEGYVNLDKIPYPHVDIIYDLETASNGSLMHFRQDLSKKPLGELVPDNTFDEIILVHVIEHIHHVLPMMEELYRVAKPGCRMTIACPYGSTDNADEDPTHVRRIFDNSFVYFSQAWYGNNDYGYRGDWELQHVLFKLRKEFFTDCTDSKQMRIRIKTVRNCVDEFVAGLVAIKPLRKAGFVPVEPKVRFLPV